MIRQLQLSSEFLDDSMAFLEQGRLRSAIDRAYYAIHYSVVALLCHLGVRPPRPHRGLVNLFGREIVKKGVMDREFSEMLSTTLGNRMDSTYSAEADINLEDAELSVTNAQRFLTEVRSILNH